MGERVEPTIPVGLGPARSHRTFILFGRHSREIGAGRGRPLIAWTQPLRLTTGRRWGSPSAAPLVLASSQGVPGRGSAGGAEPISILIAGLGRPIWNQA